MDLPASPVPLPRRTPWEIQRAVLIALFQRELKARFNGRWLGAYWVFLEPMAHLVFMMLIFGYVRHRIVPGMPVPLFLVTGMVPFFIFRSISVRVMGSVEANRALFGYRQVKPIDPLLARAALETVLYSVIYVFFLIGMGWFGMQWFPVKPLELMGISLVLIFMGLGLGLILVVVTDDVPQLRVLVRIAFMPLYLISGIIFPIHNLPNDIIDWLSWNPLMHIVELSRGYFASEYPVVDQVSVSYPLFVSVIALTLGLSLYRVRRRRLLAI